MCTNNVELHAEQLFKIICLKGHTINILEPEELINEIFASKNKRTFFPC